MIILDLETVISVFGLFQDFSSEATLCCFLNYLFSSLSLITPAYCIVFSIFNSSFTKFFHSISVFFFSLILVPSCYIVVQSSTIPLRRYLDTPEHVIVCDIYRVLFDLEQRPVEQMRKKWRKKINSKEQGIQRRKNKELQ